MSTIVIRLDGVDITDDVIITSATFAGGVNGVAGPCQFKIKDLSHVYGPIAGKVITLDIDGQRKFKGFAQKISKVYAFPVVNTENPEATPREFLIEGEDINVLFNKRVVFNPGTPTKGALPPPTEFRCSASKADEWAEDTSVFDTVTYLIENFTTMVSEDGLTLDITNFGTPNPDRCAAYSAAVTVGQLLSDLNRNLQGIFYITPNEELRFHDADTDTTVHYLTDQPDLDDPLAHAPRDYSALSDAGKMVNDAMVWGAALGYDKITFAREIDNDDSGGDSSITTHGRWQYADFNGSMFRQATVDERAHSIVYGVSGSQKGARWDRVAVEATLFDPVFNLGDVVTCHFRAYDGIQYEPFEAPDGNGVSEGECEISLPIRRMVITFPTPTEAMFKLQLSREVDAPFSAFEFLFPRFHPSLPVIEIPHPPVLPGPSTQECECGITDTFDRANSTDDLGMASSGYRWIGPGGNIVSGVAEIPTGGGPTLGLGSISTPTTLTVSVPYPSSIGGDDVLGVIRLYVPGDDFVQLAWQEEEDVTSPSGWKLSTLSITKGAAVIDIDDPGQISAFPYDIALTVDPDVGVSASVAGYAIAGTSFTWRNVEAVYLLGFRVE